MRATISGQSSGASTTEKRPPTTDHSQLIRSSGGGGVYLPEFCLTVQADGLQLEGILSRGNHDQRDWRSIWPGVEVLGLQPGTKPGIVNLRLAPPEPGVQATLNLEMIQLQLDDGNIPGEIPPNVRRAHVEPSQTATLALCFDHHTHLLFNNQMKSVHEAGVKGNLCWRLETTVHVSDLKHINQPDSRLHR